MRCRLDPCAPCDAAVSVRQVLVQRLAATRCAGKLEIVRCAGIAGLLDGPGSSAQRRCTTAGEVRTRDSCSGASPGIPGSSELPPPLLSCTARVRSLMPVLSMPLRSAVTCRVYGSFDVDRHARWRPELKVYCGLRQWYERR